jgi:putative hydrolase of HD superfamily
MTEHLEDLLKILIPYELKCVARKSSNHYTDSHLDKEIIRGETTAEHVYSSLKLADYMISSHDEFKKLDKLKVYEILMYHDDCEIEAGDVCIADTKARINKEQQEIEGVKLLAQKYPHVLGEKLLTLDNEYRNSTTPEAKFSKGIDKLDALIHELKYPGDWGTHKGFGYEQVEKYFRSSFEHSSTFSLVFDNILVYLDKNKYFDNN